MTSTINASTSSGIVQTADTSGVLALQTVGTTALTINTSQQVAFTNAADLPNTFGFKNRIINGQMQIDQRNAGAVVTGDNTYTLDRWYKGATQASKFSVQQGVGNGPSGFNNYLLVQVTSSVSVGSGDTFWVQQSIEGFNVADLNWGTANAKTVTLSFQVISSLTGTFGGALINSAANRSYPFSYTISSANTWTTIAVTIPGDTTGTWLINNGIGIGVRFGLGSGSTYTGTSGSWAAANYVQPTGTVSVVGTSSANWAVTGVQLEKGSIATSFDYRPYSTELSLCQRYFQVVQNGLVATTSSGNLYGAQSGYYVQPRTSPTVAFLSSNSAYQFPSTAGTVTAVTQNGFLYYKTASATVGGANYQDSLTVSAEL